MALQELFPVLLPYRYSSAISSSLGMYATWTPPGHCPYAIVYASEESFKVISHKK